MRSSSLSCGERANIAAMGLGNGLGEQQVELLDEAVELRPRESPFLYQFEYLVVLAVLPLLQLLHLYEESRGIERHVEPPRVRVVRESR